MNTLWFGISNVGKSVSGKLPADYLEYKFFIPDDEVQKSEYHP